MMRKLLLFFGFLALVTSARGADAGAIVSISNIKNIVPGYSGSFDVVLNSSSTEYYTTLGLDVQLPDGFTYTGYTAGALLTESHASNIFRSDQGNNTSRFSSYANPTADFTAKQGVLLTIHFTVDAAATTGTAWVKNASFTLGTESCYATDASAELTVGNTVTFDETAANSIESISNVNVTINRTLKASVWNTICLPFSMTSAQISSIFGAGTELASLTKVTNTKEYNEDEDEDVITALHLTFQSETEIAAHKPYIIKVPASMTSFTVNGVSVSSGTPEYNAGTESNYKKFIGTYKPISIPDGGIYITDNQFKYSGGHATLKSFRGYFSFRDKLFGYRTASAPAITFDFGDATGISSVGNAQSNAARDRYYTLSGQLTVQPSKGVYIQNGKKVVIK